MKSNANINISISNLEGLQKVFNLVKGYKNVTNDTTNISNYLAQKVLDVVKEQTEICFSLIPTTNEQDYQTYRNANIIEKIDSKGFIISNSSFVESKNYRFSLALAFEFGTGIKGMEDNPKGHWDYFQTKNPAKIDGKEVQGWWIAIDKVGRTDYISTSKSGKAVVTQGYHAMEIYRKSFNKITENDCNLIKSWINSYIEEMSK